MTTSPALVIKPSTGVQFVKAEVSDKHSLVCSIDGPSKTGKTEFALSMPGPICIHDFNCGTKGVIEKWINEGKEIYKFDYEVPLTGRPGTGVSDLPGAATKVWTTFVEQFLASLTIMRSVVVDLSSEAWELVRLARFGKLDKVVAVNYGAVNVEFRQLTQKALRSGCNVGFLHKLRPKYVNNSPTSEMERAGFGDIGYDVEATLVTARDSQKKGVDQFAITIDECRNNMNANGLAFVGKDATFAKVASAIFPNTKEEDWT